ncbi:hypothetical protein T265_03737 [Opisthorchis viverrini]|uniref:Uncharacterized protein n=1 Tax=Opisthorchis viverrini TaxID=6198 RepID=A0A074ZRL6_OPIVI|nr:hypothetical protein T265_03737 [Opisthorchis viverrini]KER29721.1 hypothetical protein T265_03737 [Opisthorchis viverrini]
MAEPIAGQLCFGGLRLTQLQQRVQVGAGQNVSDANEHHTQWIQEEEEFANGCAHVEHVKRRFQLGELC